MNSHSHPVDPSARYHRQTLLPQIGEAGQRRLSAGHAAIIGCGALGTAAAELLCRAGVGTLTLIDRDIVELTNLQRQLLFDEDDARQSLPKAHAARDRLARINSEIIITAQVADVSPRTLERLIGDAPLLLDCTDNFETRYLINDAAVKLGRALVYGGAVGTSGTVLTIIPRDSAMAREAGPGPCLRCLFEDAPAPGATPTCDTAGVLGTLTALVGALQAAEAIKLLAAGPAAATRGVLSIDGWSAEFRRIHADRPRADCPCCAERRFDWLEGARGGQAAALCGRGAIQITPQSALDAPPLDLAALAQRLAPHGAFTASRLVLRGRLEHERADTGAPVEVTIFADGRAIIGGVTRVESARALYAKYIGG